MIRQCSFVGMILDDFVDILVYFGIHLEIERSELEPSQVGIHGAFPKMENPLFNSMEFGHRSRHKACGGHWEEALALLWEMPPDELPDFELLEGSSKTYMHTYNIYTYIYML